MSTEVYLDALAAATKCAAGSITRNPKTEELLPPSVADHVR